MIFRVASCYFEVEITAQVVGEWNKVMSFVCFLNMLFCAVLFLRFGCLDIQYLPVCSYDHFTDLLSYSNVYFA